MFSRGIVGEVDAGADGADGDGGDDVDDGDDGDDGDYGADGDDDHHDHRVLDVGLHQLLSWPHTLVITPTQEKQIANYFTSLLCSDQQI